MDGILSRFRSQLSENEPSDRSFGLLFAAALLVLGLRQHWTGFGGRGVPALAASVGIAILALASPQILRTTKRAWLFLGFLLSLVMHPLVMSVLFYGVVTPAGALMRLFGHDPLRLRRLPASTYWIARTKPASDMTEEF
jgi:hypothetical protein